MLSVYTRHHPDCKNAGDKTWRRCNCPKWIWGSLNGQFIRQSARTHRWEEAEELRRQLAEGLPPSPAQDLKTAPPASPGPRVGVAPPRTFLIEDMRNGGDPGKPHGVCEVKLKKGKIVHEGSKFSLAEMRRLGRKQWRNRFTGPTYFIAGKDKAKLSYFWDHVYLRAKSGPNLGGVVNPDSGLAILDAAMEKLTALDFRDKIKVAEALTAPRGGTTRFSALWQADRKRIQRMAPVEYIGRYMEGWFDFAIADELHQLAGDTAQGNALGAPPTD